MHINIVCSGGYENITTSTTHTKTLYNQTFRYFRSDTIIFSCIYYFVCFNQFMFKECARARCTLSYNIFFMCLCLLVMNMSIMCRVRVDGAAAIHNTRKKKKLNYIYFKTPAKVYLIFYIRVYIQFIYSCQRQSQ